MSVLWWVRHGPTHARGMIGWTDLPADLSDTARIARLRGHLPSAPVISSTLGRAITTADAVQGDRPRLRPDPDLREIHFGDWEERTHDDIAAEDPARIRAFWERPDENSAPGGEGWRDLRARVDAAADRLVALGHPDVIVVAHFGAILTQYQRIAGLSTVTAFGQTVENLSVTRLRYGAGAEVLSVNHAP